MHHLGHTTSSNKRDHLLLAPDTFIRTPMPGITKGFAIVHVAPQAGAAFTQMTVELDANGTLTEGPTQRLIYVLEGKLTLQEPSSKKQHQLAPGSYAYLPTEHPHTITAKTKARLAVIDKPYMPLETEPNPEFFIGREQDLKPTALNGDPDLEVRALMPDSPQFDFACNTMTYQPGASLPQVEIHYMEHGLLMLEGGGIYRLGDAWYPTQAGDFIWMAPYCPQWFGAIGKKPAKYLIYKDFNRHTLA
ncbi:(S)-ureidoglycine aminohydrolase [Granulicella cerasi]|uniref:(S)-ureidoglycine aminohydrolase n=1 Tax=Granulicella cerasi TaxID=741063 RepID=A0ABW1Z7W0_9BACT|nr:(S)-ureidoglycine aminohydrolase [Granulicella cerasi]